MGQHFYHKDGRPCYEILGKNGKMRDVTIRDAKKLDLVPSNTTITNCISKPGLNIWLQREVAKAAFNIYTNLLVHVNTKEEEFIKTCIDAAQVKGNKAKDFGIRIHDAIEFILKARSNNVPNNLQCPEVARDDEIFPFLAPIHAYIKNRGIAGESEKIVIGHHKGLYYGGKIDNPHNNIIRDFKTQNTVNGKFKRYDEWLMQLAGYMIISPQCEKIENVLISSTEPGVIETISYTEEEVLKGMKMFEGALIHWYGSKGL